jgi:hypothetical protein
MPAKGSEMKRTRRDRGEMEDIMFKLFERQPNWTLRQLIQETDQPEVGFFITHYCITLIVLFLILYIPICVYSSLVSEGCELFI